jgi:hypothetical protein
MYCAFNSFTAHDEFSCTWLLANSHCFLMISGVWINGHRYQQGDSVAFMPVVSRRFNLSDSLLSRNLVGTINMFYIVKNSGALDEVYVSLSKRPILDMEGDLYIVDSVRPETWLPGFKFVHQRGQHVIVHVDAITAKILLVPHFDQQADEAKRQLKIKELGKNAPVSEHPPPCPSMELMCGIKMWDAR